MADTTTPNLTVQPASPTAYQTSIGGTDLATQVSSAYENLFGRAPDVGGFKFWTTNLAPTASQADVNTALLQAAASEAQGNVPGGGSDWAAYQASLNKSKGVTPTPTSTNTIPTTNSLSTYDPYSQYRGQAATQLNSLVNNPDIAMSQGGYQAQLQQGITASQRAAASTGQLQSGGEQNAISNLAQGQFSTYYNNLFNQLSTLSGANQSPASATAAQNAAQVSSYMAPYQAQSLAANAALSQTNANVAGYMAPYTAAQTQAQTNYISGAQTAQTQAQTNYISGAQTALAQAQAQAASAQARGTGANTVATNLDTAGGILGGLGSAISGITSILGF